MGKKSEGQLLEERQDNPDNLQEILDDIPTDVYMSINKRNGIHSFTIKWMESGRGFGEYTIIEEGGRYSIDTEGDGKDMVLRMFGELLKKCEEVG